MNKNMNIVYIEDILKRKIINIREIIHLDRFLSQIWKRLAFGRYTLRMHFDAVYRPQYAFGVYSASMQAKALGLNRISVFEFGVAGGNGLLALEDAAINIGKELNIEIDVFGFDLFTGLPEPKDYRDLSYWFLPNSFQSDVDKLKSRLRTAILVSGDVKDTIPSFLDSFNTGPIGFCSFDLDYYSSTSDALRILNGVHHTRLPRTICYFDDIVGISDLTILCHDVGQLLAIDEFNDNHPFMNLCPIHKLRNKRIIKYEWNDHIYALHDFKHPLYNTIVNPFSSDYATRSTSI